MLAHKYKDHKHKIKFPAYVFPKLDGCLYYSSKVLTEDGPMNIGTIVDNKMKVKVLSYNEKTGVCEYKKVVNWFNTGKSPNDDWMSLLLPGGNNFRVTKNHRIYTDHVWVEAQHLDSHKHKIMMKSTTYQNQLIAGTLLGDSSFSIDLRIPTRSYRLIFCHVSDRHIVTGKQIGRASCRERVCLYV